MTTDLAAPDPSLAQRAVAGARQTVEGVIVPVAKSAVGRFFATAAAMATFTAALLVVAALVAAPAPWWAVSLALTAAATAGTVGGIVLAPKRAISGAIAEGLRRTRLGAALSALVFDRLLDVDDDERHGERGVALARHTERLPLATAEARLRAVVDRLVRDPGEGDGLRAWLRRKIRAALLEQVERVTLARFREDAQAHGGVDLVIVRDELAVAIDGQLVGRFEGAAATTTYLVIAAVAAVAVGAAALLRTLAS